MAASYFFALISAFISSDCFFVNPFTETAVLFVKNVKVLYPTIGLSILTDTISTKLINVDLLLKTPGSFIEMPAGSMWISVGKVLFPEESLDDMYFILAISNR